MKSLNRGQGEKIAGPGRGQSRTPIPPLDREPLICNNPPSRNETSYQHPTRKSRLGSSPPPHSIYK
ncbi:hypothetical protein DL98DRAFT_512170 [Cadophora sp. DSE1049]|nr:hypothetical protein DL98DRAFT_512170 [Cadophora sp. DSE1049]